MCQDSEQTVKDKAGKTDIVGVTDKFLLDEKSAAGVCGIGKTLFRELDKDGSVPEPSRLHSRKIWSARQLEIWCVIGCPARSSEKWRDMLKKIEDAPEKYL